MLAEEAKERQREHGGTAPGRPKEETLDLNSDQVIDEQPPRSPQVNKVAAEMVGIGHDTVARMKKVMEEAPELAEQVKSGERTVNSA